MRSARPFHASGLCGMFGGVWRIDGFRPKARHKPQQQWRYRKNLQGQMGKDGTVSGLLRRCKTTPNIAQLQLEVLCPSQRSQVRFIDLCGTDEQRFGKCTDIV